MDTDTTTAPSARSASSDPATAISTAAASAAPGALDDLLDRAAIEQLVHRLGTVLDDGRFEVFHDLLTEDATAATPGGQAAGVEALIAQAARNHDPARAIQHQIGGVLVDLDGDTATVRANVVVTFALGAGDAPYERLGGVYGFDARRTVDGWRLSRVATRPVWQEGEPLPATT